MNDGAPMICETAGTAFGHGPSDSMTRKEFTVSALLVGLALWCSPLFAQPTIEEAYLFPERYADQTLIFDVASLRGEIRREDGFFLLDVRSRDGTDVRPVLSARDGMAFLVSSSIAESLLKDEVFKPNHWLRVRLTCRMEQVHAFLNRLAWVCNVSSIALLDLDLDVIRTVPPHAVLPKPLPKPAAREKRATP